MRYQIGTFLVHTKSQARNQPYERGISIVRAGPKFCARKISLVDICHIFAKILHHTLTAILRIRTERNSMPFTVFFLSIVLAKFWRLLSKGLRTKPYTAARSSPL